MRQQFTPSLGAFVSLGATVVEDKNNSQRVLPTWQVNLDGAWPITRHLSLTFSSQRKASPIQWARWTTSAWYRASR